MTLPVKAYDFLIKTLRDEDRLRGNDFLRRFFEGIQDVWQETSDQIQKLPELTSPVLCPDDLLQYLKNVVGWTKKLDPVTKNLTAPVLRRLIGASAELWKNRTCEDSILDIVNLLFTPYARIWNWFDVRWITGVASPPATVLGEHRLGRDPYLVTFPSLVPGGGEYQTVIRVVMPEDRELFKDVMNLMRPAGEYFLIVYLLFLEEFNVDTELSQWALSMGTSFPVVADGHVHMTDDTQQECLSVAVDGSSAWEDFVIYARIQGKGPGAPGLETGFGVVINYDPATDNGTLLLLDVQANAIQLKTMTAGVEVTVATADLTPLGVIVQDDIWYGLRIQASPTGGGVGDIKVYLDGVLAMVESDAVVPGTVGVYHSDGCEAVCDEFEVMGLPCETDLIEP